jgi:serine/threonine protein kinase
MHADCKSENRVLFYPYFRDTLLALLQKDPEFPPQGRLKILQGVAEAVQKLHAEDWPMLVCRMGVSAGARTVLTATPDIKPDNVLIDWTCDSDGNKTITDVALGDFDIACNLKDNEIRLTPHVVRNAMWRSPEAQTSISTRMSAIISLGLVVSPTFAREKQSHVWSSTSVHIHPRRWRIPPARKLPVSSEGRCLPGKR